MSQIYILNVGSEDVMKVLATEYEAENWSPFGETNREKRGEDEANTRNAPEIGHHVQCDRPKARRTRAKSSLAKKGTFV